MISFVVSLLLHQAPVAPIEAIKATANEPAEVKAFAHFVGRNLITFDPDMAQGQLRLRQRERVFSLKDEDFHEPFALVPEAQSIAQKARESFRMGSIFQIVGLVTSGAGVVPVLLLPLVLSGGGVLPLLLVGLGLQIVGLVFVLVALPFLMSAQTEFLSAVATYNRGLLDLRPVGESPGRELGAPGGLLIPMP